MKFLTALSFIGLIVAQQNTAESVNKKQRPDWQPARPMYTKNPKTCGADADCSPDHICIQHMWAYNGQHESATGCWHKTVC